MVAAHSGHHVRAGPAPRAGHRRQAARRSWAGAGVGCRVPGDVAGGDRTRAAVEARWGGWDIAASGLGAAVLFMAMWMVAGATLGLLVMSHARTGRRPLTVFLARSAV